MRGASKQVKSVRKDDCCHTRPSDMREMMIAMDLVSTKNAAERELNVVVSEEHTEAFINAVCNPVAPNEKLLADANSYVRLTGCESSH